VEPGVKQKKKEAGPKTLRFERGMLFLGRSRAKWAVFERGVGLFCYLCGKQGKT